MLRLPLLVLALSLSAVAQDAAPAEEATLPSDPRVESILDGNDVEYSVEPNGDYRILFNLGESGRSHIVWVSPRTNQAGPLEIRKVYAYAAGTEPGQSLPEGLAESLLRNNTGYVIGAWARTDDRVIFTADVPAEATAEALLGTIGLVFTTADQMEQQLTDGDQW